MDKAREAALKILHAVHQQGAYANVALAKELRQGGLSDMDRRFVTELVYGTVKAGETLDWIIKKYLSRPWKKVNPVVQDILRLGTYQLRYMDKIPASAACNESVELTKKFANKGAAGFVNGILRSMAREPEKGAFPSGKGNATVQLALREQHPEWLVRRWIKEFGYDEAEQLCRFNNQQAPLSVRTNTLKTSPSELRLQLVAAGVEVQPSQLVDEGFILEEHGALDSLSALQEGYCQVQDESSMLVAHVLDPQPGDFVLDVCSAPGGKTTHLAQLMKNRGRIIAGDLYPARLEKVAENARRLGITIIETAAGDARCIGERYLRQADRVLVDAPCSGLGVLRRRPDARWRVTAEDMKGLPPLQLEILESAAQCVKQGGVLVYSTCTMEPAENAGVVEKFLAANKDFTLVETGQYLPEQKRSSQMVQLLPHIDGTDGFFIARMERKTK